LAGSVATGELHRAELFAGRREPERARLLEELHGSRPVLLNSATLQISLGEVAASDAEPLVALGLRFRRSRAAATFTASGRTCEQAYELPSRHPFSRNVRAVLGSLSVPSPSAKMPPALEHAC